MEQPKGIVIKYTADKMRAFLAVSKNFGQVTAAAALMELLHKGIVHGLNTAVVHKLVAAQLFDKYVEVAQGTPVKPAVDGRIEVLVPGAAFPVKDESRDEAMGAAAKPFCEFLAVAAGTPLVRRVPPVQGEFGMDVFGAVIAPSPFKDVSLKGGTGTAASKNDPNILVAERVGVIELTLDGEVRVHPYKEIVGDVEAGTGKVVFQGCLRIKGAVRSGAVVEALDSVAIDGEVTGASVKCGGDLALRSAVRGGAVIECGGSVEAAGIENSKLTADGSVRVAGNIVDSDVTSKKGSVKAVNIVGGNVAALAGIRAVQVGSELGVRTALDVGLAHGCVIERDNLRNSISAQNLLTEGYISELFCFVRDNMDAEGAIPEEMLPVLGTYAENLTGSVAACRGYEAEAGKLDTVLRESAGCCIAAYEVYPNVLLKLGASEQNVTEVLKNVHFKPVGVNTR